MIANSHVNALLLVLILRFKFQGDYSRFHLVSDLQTAVELG